MRLSGIDLNLLVVLEALLHEQGVTAAARRIGLSQSATSHALARLRDLLDDPILLRTSSGMVLTARARELGPVVREILESSTRIFHGGESFDPSRSQETFRVALDESAQITILPPLLERLQQVAPGVRLVVPAGARPDSLLADFERGRVDVAVSSHHPSESRDLHARFLLSAEYTTIARRGHPSAGRRLGLKRFVELRHIAVTHPSLADITIDRVLAERSLERHISLTVPEPAAVASLVARSDLIATLPRMLIDRGAASREGLRFHAPPIPLDPVPVFLIHHERSRGSAPIAWLRDQITDIVEAFSAR